MSEVLSNENLDSELAGEVETAQCSAAARPKAGNLDRSLLRDPVSLRYEYIEHRRSTYHIAREIGCDPKTVYAALRRYDIPTRPRGEHFKSGYDNLKNSHDNCMLRPGAVNPFQGRKHTAETRELLSEKALADTGRSARMTGERNPMFGRRGKDASAWQGGRTPTYLQGRTRSELQQWRRRVLARDGHRCRICGRTDNIGVHHLLSYLKYPELRSLDDNGVVLCPRCHIRLDGFTQDNETGRILPRRTSKRRPRRRFCSSVRVSWGGT